MNARTSLARFTGILCLLFVSLLVQAQSASLRGTVTDSTGAIVPNAKVTATNTATNALRTVDSNESGVYSVTNLPVGIYTVKIEKQGFAPVEFTQVELTVGQVRTIDVKFAVSSTTEVVNVVGDAAPAIELETSQISNVVDSKKMNDLPLLTRNPYELILLSPGTMQSNSSLGGFSANGSRERNNNFMLDGVDNNDTSVPGIPGGLISLNPDATQEFRVITNTFMPEYGRNTGAVVDIVTKSGTNRFNGDAYWFGRYSALGARDFFNHLDGESKNPYVRNQFGYSIGGPIKKDKTFFFFNNEYQIFHTTLSTTSEVPTDAYRTGKFTIYDRAGNPYQIDLSDPNSSTNALGLSLDPTVQQVLSLYPEPNAGSVDSLRGLYQFSQKSMTNTANVTLKLDHRFSDTEVATVRYAYNRFKDPNPGFDAFLPGYGATGTEQQTNAIAVGLTSTLSPTKINEFRFGVNRNDAPFSCGNVSGIDSVTGGADLYLTGIASFACANLGDSNGQSRRSGTWSFADNYSWVKGNHTIKFGGDFRFIFNNGYNGFYSRNSLSFAGYTDLGIDFIDPGVTCNSATGVGCFSNMSTYQNIASTLFGVVSNQYQAQFFDNAGNRTAIDNRLFRQREYSGFAQDSWKVRSNLTFNYGLRYQLNGVPFEVNNNLSNLFQDPSGVAPFDFTIVGPGTGHQLYNNDFTDWEPRIGFAWDPFSKGKTSIRGAYGIFHDRIFANLFGNARGNPPFEQDVNWYPDTFDQALLPNLAPLPTQASSTVVEDYSFLSPVIIDRNLKMPYSQNWNFGVQQELPGDVTFEINYVGSKGTRLLRVVDGNPPQPDLVNQLVQYCSDPTNEYGCSVSDLQFNLLRYGSLYGLIPFDTVNNNAFLGASVNKSIAFSTYHSLQLNVTKRMSHNFQVNGAYTWSHAIDNASDPLVPGAGSRSYPRNSFNLAAERGNSDFDLRHRLVINYILNLPIGTGHRLFGSGPLGKVFESWELAGISTFQTGHPYSTFGNIDTEFTTLSSRLDLIGQPVKASGACTAVDGCPTGVSIDSFDIAPFGRGGNSGRNSFFGPGYSNWDLVLSKKTKFREGMNLETRFEFFNLFNQVQYAMPGASWSNPGTFGISTSTITRPDGTTSARQIQVGMKLHF
ncbi:MAG TPA: TonB-dependent receptor [Terriglobales bacterium]